MTLVIPTLIRKRWAASQRAPSSAVSKVSGLQLLLGTCAATNALQLHLQRFASVIFFSMVSTPWRARLEEHA